MANLLDDILNSMKHPLALKPKSGPPTKVARITTTQALDLRVPDVAILPQPKVAPKQIPEVQPAIPTSPCPEPVVQPSTTVAAPIVPLVVSDSHQCRKICLQLAQADVLAVDCEGVNLGRHGQLCLIQIASPKLVVLFDPLPEGEALFSAGLRSLLQHESIVKVMHDCRRDADALAYQFQTTVNNVFDTQLAFAVLCRQDGRNTPLPVSLNTVLRKYARGATNEFKDEARAAMIADSNFWLKRPLTADMIGYAAQDVSMLLEVHTRMLSYLYSQTRPIVKTRSQCYADQLRCLTDEEYAVRYPPTATAAVVANAEKDAAVKKDDASLQTVSGSGSGRTDGGAAAPVVRKVPKYGIAEFDYDVELQLQRREANESYYRSRGRR